MDKNFFRQVMGHFATGVTIVSAPTPEGAHGLTVNAFSSVSLDPPIVLVCIEHDRYSHQLIRQAGCFAVNVLNEKQRHWAERFSGLHAEEARFEGIRYRREATGAPVFEEALAYLDCHVVAAHPAGDHTIFVGRVETAGLGPAGRPLLFYGGRYLPLIETPAEEAKDLRGEDYP